MVYTSMLRINADYNDPFVYNFYALVIEGAYLHSPEAFLTTKATADLTSMALQDTFHKRRCASSHNGLIQH